MFARRKRERKGQNRELYQLRTTLVLIKRKLEITTTMSGTGNRLSAQEDLNGYEDAGSGTAEQILQNNKGRVDRENKWAPSMLVATVGNNPVAAYPEAMLNHMMQWGGLGNGNTGGAALMRGEPLHHRQTQHQRQFDYTKWGVSRQYGMH